VILQWKNTDDGYCAFWQGIFFTLFEDAATRRWRCKVSGATVPPSRRGDAERVVSQTWPKAVAAMQDIENRQQKLIMAATRSTRAGGAVHKVADIRHTKKGASHGHQSA
jgi:hypothetical protein